MAGGLITVSQGVKEKLGVEFRKFGSNIVVIPKSDTIEVGLPGITFGSVTEQGYINETDLWKIKKIDNWSANVLGYAPFLYQVVKVSFNEKQQEVVLAGTYFEHKIPEVVLADGSSWTTGIRQIAPYWQVTGEWIKSDNDTQSAIIGTTISEKFGLVVGSAFNVTYLNIETQSTTNYTLNVIGIVTTGGTEDSQIFVNLAVAQNISDRPNKVHSVQVSGLCINCPAEWIAAEIEKKIDYVQAKSVKQLVNAESRIMDQLEQMLMLITVVALMASGLCVMMVMTTTVIERRKEIGLMKAIGADNKKIGTLFIAEATTIGFIGGVIGYIVGYFIAQYIANRVFSTPIPLIPIILPITVGISLGVTILASILPVKRAMGIEPAIVLRGE
jgi:putative ABC transport system permease protein